MHNSHNLIALITGAVSVNIYTPIDAMFTSHVMLCVIVFCAKGIIGAGISIGINRLYDAWKNNKTA